MHRLPVVVRGRAVQRNAGSISDGRECVHRVRGPCSRPASEARPVGGSLAAQICRSLPAMTSSGLRRTFRQCLRRHLRPAKSVAPPAPPPHPCCAARRPVSRAKPSIRHHGDRRLRRAGRKPGRIFLAHALNASHAAARACSAWRRNRPRRRRRSATVAGDSCVFVNDVVSSTQRTPWRFPAAPACEFQQVQRSRRPAMQRATPVAAAVLRRADQPQRDRRGAAASHHRFQPDYQERKQ